MAEGARRKFRSDYAISTSGVAGPDGGSDEKPVGTVWVAIAGPKKTIAKKYNFGGSRSRNIAISALTALNWLRNEFISGELE
jgi:nicotinamide-nucleotide amidase